MERGKKLLITPKFAKILAEMEYDVSMRAWETIFMGQSLGEELGQVEYPENWRRFIKRKDCPQYMKKIVTQSVNAYYPKLSLPKENHWVTFEQQKEKDEQSSGSSDQQGTKDNNG